MSDISEKLKLTTLDGFVEPFVNPYTIFSTDGVK